jgi:ubiquinone/menaquinone biosynthesis C-methylase UbiE
MVRARAVDINLRSGAQMAEYKALADRIAADRPGRLLDWGCGFGQVTALLRERGVNVEPFDHRPALEAVSRETLHHYPSIMCTVSPDPVALPYDDGEFDAVLSCGVLEHVQDPTGSLRELRRVLRAGGRLYVVKLPNRRSYLEWIAKHAGLYYHGQLDHDVVYTTTSASRLIAAHGFRVDAVRLANMLPLTIDHPAAARLAAPIWRLNRRLERIPLLSRLATNIEVDAIAV